METLLLSRRDIEQVISMKDAVEIVERTFRGMGEGTVSNPTKAALDLGEAAPWPPHRGFMNAMPAYVGWLESAGMKWVGGFHENPARGLPFISSMILLIDPHDGRFVAALDGVLVTALRTGAQTAVALKHLHGGSSLRIGLFGAGVQARSQVRAIAELFSIEGLTVYDLRREAAQALAAELHPLVLGGIRVADRPEEAAAAEAVICATMAKDKFLREAWIKPGATIVPMGSYQECEDALLLGADKIVVDHIEQTLHRGALRDVAAAGLVTAERIHATLGEVVAGKKPGRESAAERIVCVPLGVGAHDIAVATVAYRRALAQGLGGRFAFA
jgi:ornithine cyclodeaminase/alanine dehydrogenase